MVLRYMNGHIIFSSCRHLFTCDNALSAELEACREGAALAMEWSSLPFILETESSEAAAMIMQTSTNRSSDAGLVHEIEAIIHSGRQVKVRAVRRGSNRVSHELARVGRACMKQLFGCVQVRRKLQSCALWITLIQVD